MDDLKAFRQVGSKTPGHPEAGHTDGIAVCLSVGEFISHTVAGVEVTTGPLGQGFSNGVGLAIAQAHLGAVYNRDGFELINNYTYGNYPTPMVFLPDSTRISQSSVVMDVSWRVLLARLPVLPGICSLETS